MKKVLARRTQEEFIGRISEKEKLTGHALNASGGLRLLHAPRVGATELLQQTYDELFASSSTTIPIYFELQPDDEGTSSEARRFALSFLSQFIAFRRRDPFIIHTAPGITELRRLALPQDDALIDEICNIISYAASDENGVSFRRACYALPIRAAAHGFRTAIIFDSLERAASGSTIEEAAAQLDRAGIPFIAALRRRSAVGMAIGRRMDLNPLSYDELGQAAAKAASTTGIDLSDAVRDLIAVRSCGDLLLVWEWVNAAAQSGSPLDSFRAFETVYTGSLFGGGTAGLFEKVIEGAAGSLTLARVYFAKIAEAIQSGGAEIPVEAWQRRIGEQDPNFEETIRRLNTEELISLTANRIQVNTENRAFRDYVAARTRLESQREPRAAVFSDMLSSFIKSAPAEMGEHYKRSSAIGLRELMSSFKGKTVPLALIDYSQFSDELKGLSPAAMIDRLQNTKDRFPLPEIVFSAHTSAFFKAIGAAAEKELSAIAIGFEQGDLGGENRTAWIAAEIESKLEANVRTTEIWCERLEAAAAASGFLRYRLWLIAPEGFSPESMELLARRNGIGSSRKQADMLAKFLNTGEFDAGTAGSDEYEIVIPMGSDSEMVAVHTLEDIARRHNIPQQETNRIKTALVEACINASEHSKSPDKRIHQRFTVGPDRITITISNRGLRLLDKPVAVEPNEGRRGWGLKLMRQLMDEVHFESVDDGTRISMTKYFSAA